MPDIGILEQLVKDADRILRERDAARADLAAARQDLLREGAERDEARTEVERLRGEVEVKSNWETVAVAQNEEIERLRAQEACIVKVLDAEYRSEPLHVLVERLRAEVEKQQNRTVTGIIEDSGLRYDCQGCTGSPVNGFAYCPGIGGCASTWEVKAEWIAERLRAAPPIVTTETHVQIPRADYERVAHLLDGDAAPPVVHTTNIEAAARDLATRREGVLPQYGSADRAGLIGAILRKHTRPIDREGLARLLYERVERSPWLEYHTWETLPETVRPGWIARADAVLRYLGAQGMSQAEAEAAFSPERVAKAREQLAAGDYEVLGAQAAQPVEPKPPEPAWTQEQRNAAACVARVLHDEWTVFTTPHSDSGAAIERVCAALTTCAPLFAKVRVKLPRFAVMARHEIVTALREQGVEVDE